ncbi:UDP-N-acetylenolpyruvoylglucosamine reductase [hydrothermal vent metagenome]|uniref:UDP-N-acetylmuramate dehydrogenase n=1 Tax=hydrothermal vent metagenome TaxID=652676 RepID=A0A3B1B3T1_9ZZZZ
MLVVCKQDSRGEMLYDEPLSRHTTWRVGGPAQRFYRPAGSLDLVRFLQSLPANEPLLWLGMGSNLLVRDGGFMGTVVATQGCLNGLEFSGGDLLRAEAGVACPHVVQAAARENLCGVEFLAGIPGTIGGALAMNAGAFGGQIWALVEKVETVDRAGTVRQRVPEDFEINYRKVMGPQGEWFLAAWLRLEQGETDKSLEKVRQLLEQRAATQPIGLPSCGSVFRNPEGDHAASLIEAAGLKGVSVGGATVSEKHANFIINAKDATAADIEELIGVVQQEVEAHSGIKLHTEVCVVGEK